MEIYKMGTKLIFGVSGGMFNGEMKEPEAMIFSNRPTPTKLWKTPIEKSENPFNREKWETQYVFREFKGDGKKFYILQMESTWYEPTYSTAKAEIFVGENYVKEKINSLLKKDNITEYHWNTEKIKWTEMAFGCSE